MGMDKINLFLKEYLNDLKKKTKKGNSPTFKIN